MKNKQKRFYLIILLILSIGLAIFFVLKALEEKIVFFYSPTELLEKQINKGQLIRVGGLVLNKSINYDKEGLLVTFIITDTKSNLKVNYEGILPDLFREGQGVVAEGTVDETKNIFYARSVLAKHDENYMPPEVKKIIDN